MTAKAGIPSPNFANITEGRFFKMNVTLKVAGMHCNGCSTNLEKMLNKREGVLSAKVSLEDAAAVVEYDESKVDLAGLREVVENCGFDVVD